MLVLVLGPLLVPFIDVLLNAVDVESVAALVKTHKFLLVVQAKGTKVIVIRAVVVEILWVDEGSTASLAHDFGFFGVGFDLFVEELLADVALSVSEENTSAVLKMAICKRGNDVLLSTSIGVS